MRYTAEVAVQAGRALTIEQIDELAAIGGVAAARPGERRAEVTFTVVADSMGDAARYALERVAEVVPCKPLSVAIMTHAEADYQSERVRFPTLVGVTEVTQLLGVSKQRLAVLRQRPEFPAPVATLAAGPIWRADDLSTFADGWRRQPGRPRKVLTSGQ